MQDLLASLQHFQLSTAAGTFERMFMLHSTDCFLFHIGLPMSYHYGHSFLRTPSHGRGGSISNSPATSNDSNDRLDGPSPWTPYSVPQPSPPTLAELNLRKDSDEQKSISESKESQESQTTQTSRTSSAIARAHVRAQRSMGFDNLDSLDVELPAPFEGRTSLQGQTIVESPKGILLVVDNDHLSPPQHYQPEEPVEDYLYAIPEFASSPNKRPRNVGDDSNELQPSRKRCRHQSIIAGASSAEDEGEDGEGPEGDDEMEPHPHPQAPTSSSNGNQCPCCFRIFSKSSALSRHRHCVSPRHLNSQRDWDCLDFSAGPLTVYLCSQPGCTRFQFAGRRDVLERHVKSAHNGVLYNPVPGTTEWQYSTKKELQQLLSSVHQPV
jgi:hypothetical protein